MKTTGRRRTRHRSIVLGVSRGGTLRQPHGNPERADGLWGLFSVRAAHAGRQNQQRIIVWSCGARNRCGLASGYGFEEASTGVSTRDLEGILQPSKGSIGASKSSISRKAVAQTSLLLKEFTSRSLEDFDLLALFIDGTSFAQDQMIIAMGVNPEGQKKVLGFVQASTENHLPIADLLRSLQARGLRMRANVLVCIDGSKGIRKAVKTVFENKALIQRCQWHKRENVASYLPKNEQETFKKRLQNAFDRPTLSEAKKAIKELESELESSNQNALRSLQEGQEEVLTLHRLGLARCKQRADHPQDPVPLFPPVPSCSSLWLG